MDNFDYLFVKARENGKVAKALSEKLQTDVDKNKIVDEIGNIDVGAIMQGIVKGTGVTLRDVVDTASNISDNKYTNNLRINSIDCVNATSVGSYAMANCMPLKSVNMPVATNVGVSMLRNCVSLTSVNMPSAKSIGSSAMANCLSLRSVNMPVAERIDGNAMYNCILLKSVRLGANQVATLANANAFANTPIAKATGYIYVPDDLVDSYKTATNWSVYADQIKPMSEYVEEE